MSFDKAERFKTDYIFKAFPLVLIFSAIARLLFTPLKILLQIKRKKGKVILAFSNFVLHRNPCEKNYSSSSSSGSSTLW